jgi:hypothetical protein
VLLHQHTGSVNPKMVDGFGKTDEAIKGEKG